MLNAYTIIPYPPKQTVLSLASWYPEPQRHDALLTTHEWSHPNSKHTSINNHLVETIIR